MSGILQITIVISVGVEIDISIELAFLMRDDGGHGGVPCIHHGAHHVEEAIYANVGNALYRQPGLLQHQRQCNQTNPGTAVPIDARVAVSTTIRICPPVRSTP